MHLSISHRNPPVLIKTIDITGKLFGKRNSSGFVFRSFLINVSLIAAQEVSSCGCVHTCPGDGRVFVTAVACCFLCAFGFVLGLKFIQMQLLCDGTGRVILMLDSYGHMLMSVSNSFALWPCLQGVYR